MQHLVRKLGMSLLQWMLNHFEDFIVFEYEKNINPMRALKYIAVLSFLTSCKERVGADKSLNQISQSEQQQFSKDSVLKLYKLSLTLPKGWRIANDDTLSKLGDATTRYRFHNSSGKLIHLQYGLGTIGNPAEPKVQSFRFRKGYVKNKADTSDIIFTDNQKLTAIRGKTGYTYTEEQISGFQALFYNPQTPGTGYTGLYIDSIGQIAGNIADFTFYAKDLDSAESKEILRVVRSLKINSFN